MPKKERGSSHSKRPLSHRSPGWCRYTQEEVEALVIKLAREGNTQSKIGVIMRDQYGIPLVKTITGKGVSDILKENNLSPSVPEDLDAMVRKAAQLRAHLDRNRSDAYNRRAVQVIEAKIHSLANYYKSKGVLPEDWKYASEALS